MMAWIKIDDGRTEHEKIVGVVSTPRIGARTYYELDRLMGWCARGKRGTPRRDHGEIPNHIIQHELRTPTACIRLLEEKQLVCRVDGGYRIHDWADYQAPLSNAERQAEYRRNHQNLTQDA